MSRDAPIVEAIELSNRILTAIDDKKWDNVTELDQKRVKLIESYFNAVEAESCDAGLIMKLKQLNDDIVSRLKDLQKHTRNLQVEFQQGKKVSKAYQDNQK